MMKQPKNIDDLTTGLCEIFADLCNSTIKTGVAKEATNAAGKIIGTVKVQCEYFALRKESPNIPFLNYKRDAK